MKKRKTRRVRYLAALSYEIDRADAERAHMLNTLPPSPEQDEHASYFAGYIHALESVRRSYLKIHRQSPRKKAKP